MEDGSHRAQHATGGRRRAAEEPEDVLARHGLLGPGPAMPPPSGGRRHAAEGRAAAVTESGRHVADAGPRFGAANGRNGAPDLRSRTPGDGRNGLPVPPPGAGSRRPPDDGPARRHRPDDFGLAGRAARDFGVESSGAARRAASNGHPPSSPYGSTERDRRNDIGGPAPGHTGIPDARGGRSVAQLGPPADAPSGRRRLPDPPAAAPPTARRTAPGPDATTAIRADGGRRSRTDIPEEGYTAAGGARRRRRDPGDEAGEAATHGRPLRPADTSGRAATTGVSASGGARRFRPDPTEAAGHPATTAIPATGTARRRQADSADAPVHSATTALPAAGTARRPRTDSADAPPRRRRSDPAGIDPPDTPSHTATTALPAADRARRPRTDDTVGRPADTGTSGHTTVLPAAGGARRRSRADSAARTPGPEATAVVPGPGRSSTRADASGDDPGATTRVPSVPTRSEPDRQAEREADAHTRALRIDETLTRLTAAHAGLTLAVSDGREEPPPHAPPRRPIGVTAARLLAGALAVAVLATTAFGWGTKTWLGSAVRDAAALDPESSAIVDAAAQIGDENVLVVATEPNADGAAPRADTVAVAHIPDDGGPVTVLAFPNNLEINRPPCERWDPAAATYLDDTEQAEVNTPLINALDVGGPRCLTRVVQQLSGLAITKYVGTDLGGVPAITDAVGGAQVCVQRPVLDGALGPVVPDAGPNQLTGVRAADFVRAGDVEGDPSSDYGRIERQQQVLAAVLDEAVAGTALLDVGGLRTVRPALGDALITDGAQLDEVLALAMTLRRLDADGVQFAAVPTDEQNVRGNAVLRDTDAAALFAAVRTDAPLSAEATDPGASDSGPTPSDVTVEVFNGSARSGLAGEVGETLRSIGFEVGEVASAEEPSPQTVIRFSPDQAAEAALLAATVPSATSVPDPGATGVLHLVLGRSFDDVVRAPSEPIALSAPTTEAPTEPAVTCS